MNFKIKILSPVHIRGGDTISPYADFIYNNNYILYIDNEKLWSDISEDEKILDEYIDIIKNRDINSKEKYVMYDFMKKNNIDIDKYILEKVKCTDDIGAMEIGQLIKTSGRPYIPGSSIKGAIRTAILYNYLKSNGFNIDKILNMSSKMNRRNIYVGQDVMRKSPRNIQSDIMKFLYISDTKYTNMKNISVNLEYSIDYINVKDSTRLNFKMPTANEAINEGVILKFDMKSTQFFKDEIDIIKSIQNFYKDIIRYHINTMMDCSEEIFSNIISKYTEYLNRIDDDKCILRLGSGKNFYHNTICGLFDTKYVNEKIAEVNYSMFPRTDWFILDSEKSYIKESLGWVEIIL